MNIADIEVATAVIAHEGVDCFLGKEQPASKQPKSPVSCTGGAFFGRPDEDWPRSAVGKPLLPWLQVVCSEMKNLYGALYRCQAVCFFINPNFSDVQAASVPDRGDFVVREYSTNDKLTRLKRPTELQEQPFHRVKWRKALDYPALSKYYGLFEDSVYSALCDDKKFEYQNHYGIKIGGWPTPVQSAQRYPGEFDLQIDMTENYMYGDSGIGYLSKSGSTWYVMFECC